MQPLYILGVRRAAFNSISNFQGAKEKQSVCGESILASLNLRARSNLTILTAVQEFLSMAMASYQVGISLLLNIARIARVRQLLTS